MYRHDEGILHILSQAWGRASVSSCVHLSCDSTFRHFFLECCQSLPCRLKARRIQSGQHRQDFPTRRWCFTSYIRDDTTLATPRQALRKQTSDAAGTQKTQAHPPRNTHSYLGYHSQRGDLHAGLLPHFTSHGLLQRLPHSHKPPDARQHTVVPPSYYQDRPHLLNVFFFLIVQHRGARGTPTHDTSVSLTEWRVSSRKALRI